MLLSIGSPAATQSPLQIRVGPVVPIIGSLHPPTGVAGTVAVSAIVSTVATSVRVSAVGIQVSAATVAVGVEV